MRQLAQPKVLLHAGVAALLTDFACYPRLVIWSERIHSLEFLCLMMLWSVFVLWAFVFAWQFEHARRPVFSRDFRPKLWLAATAFALAWAALLHWVIDPKLRLIIPGEYPTNGHSWAAMSLFEIAFTPLFLIFAPFAFFVRLSRKLDVSAALTVVFGILVLYLKWHSSPMLPPAAFLTALMFMRVLQGFVYVYFYLTWAVFYWFGG